MESEKPSLSAEQCIAFALECEADAKTEQNPEDRTRLLRIAAVVRELADELRKVRLSFAEDGGR